MASPTRPEAPELAQARARIEALEDALSQARADALASRGALQRSQIALSAIAAGIVVAELVFFFSFGLNQWLQYRGVGRWRSYAFGEQAYLVLSLVAKSVLAWQIYGGSLAT